ncbi:MAG TPA: hypothetical protein VK087_01125 [Tissierellaceae bacterium]|nr:hypothetical protein [Tissierellaceae bacterium]
MSKIRRIFAGSNTCQGLYSLHDNIIGENRNRLYILKGMPGGGKSSLMFRIGERALKEGFTIEYHHCPADPESIDGVVINELAIAIVDGTLPHPMDPVYPGLGDKIVNLAAYIDESKIDGAKDKIRNAKANNKRAYERAFNYFKAAKNIYNEIIAMNKEYVDFKKVNKMSKKYLNKIFSHEIVEKENYKFKTRHMFSNAYTPKGYFDYTESIIEDVKNKYYLKGDLGTGKSKFMERAINKANIEDFHLEIYYDPFVPDKIESLLIHELDLIISSNQKVKVGDYTTIDFNQYFDKSKVDNEDYKEFKRLIKKGTEALNMAERNHFAQEEVYSEAIDFTGIDKEREKIWDEIKRYI